MSAVYALLAVVDWSSAVSALAAYDWLRWIALVVTAAAFIFLAYRAVTQQVSVTTQLLRWLFGSVVIGLIAVIALPSAKSGQWIVLFVLSIGLLAIGIIIGFLFGLPKSIEPAAPGDANQSGAKPSAVVRYLQSNNNLQKVSDWLTTVITGITLTQLLQIPGYVATFGNFIHTALPDLSNAVAIGAGILFYFPSAGFVTGYLVTRLVLTPEFDKTERALASGDAQKVSEATSADFKLFGVADAEPTPEQLAAAGRISQLPLSSLVTADEKVAWARAQSIQNNWNNAILAFQQAIVLQPDDSGLLEEYANALYEAKKPLLDIITVLDSALAVATDPYAKARIMANKAQVYLDNSDYDRALDSIQQLLSDATLPKRARYYLYRARANGGRWAALHDQDADDPALGMIADSIADDAELAVDLDPTLRAALLNLAGPGGDLSDFAASDERFRAIIGEPDR